MCAVSSKMRRSSCTTSFRLPRGAEFRHYGSVFLMAQPLKVGVAGLGNVGVALVAQIAREREQLAARCGRPIEVVAICARSRSKDRGLDLRNARWFDDPVALARDGGS